MVATICFVDDINVAFQEARGILKTNDKFILGFVDRSSPLGQFYLAKKKQNVFY